MGHNVPVNIQKEVTKMTFALINVLFKGTATAIKKALDTIDGDYFIANGYSFDPDNIDASDSTIIEAGVLFNIWDQEHLSEDKIPFAAIPDIKFIGLGDGGDDSRSDGSYVFYKGFGETSISECFRFSYFGPHMEEFDAQYEVLEKASRTFMDHEWNYEFEDYSCGELVSWEFKGKEAKKLIDKWKND